MNESQKRQHWSATLSLTAVLLVIWFIATFVMSFFARELYAVHLFGFPLSFYMGAQGTLIVYIVLIGVYARRMRRIDEACGVAEDSVR